MTDDATQTDASSIDTMTDPESLRDHAEVEFFEETHTYDSADFVSIREDLEPIGGWIVAGVPNDEESVLLMDDGSHGWTLPAVSVRDEGWLARGRRAVEGLTGVPAAIDRIERVRRIDYEEADGDDRVVVHHVVCRANPVEGTPVADEPTVGCDGSPEAGWFDALPEGVEGVPAADARLFLG